jgi:hypothetical protein
LANKVDFLPFAISPSANVLSQTDYEALAAVASGFVQGVAVSPQLNKVWRQSSFIAAALATLMSEDLAQDVLDNGDLPGFVAQLRAALIANQPRQPLVVPRTLYIAPNGSDTLGDGSAGNPFQTPQHAFDYAIAKFDFGGETVTLQLADGLYTTGIYAYGTATGGTASSPVIINGNATSPGNVVINTTNGTDVIAALGGSSVMVQHITMQSTSITGVGGGACLRAGLGGVVQFNNVVFGPCGGPAGTHMWSAQGGAIYAVGGSYAINGGAVIHAQAIQGSFCQISSLNHPVAIAITGNPTFSGSFVDVRSNGVIESSSLSYTGNAHGVRYAVRTGAILNTGGVASGTPTFFPGDVAGTVDSGTYGILN